MVCAKDMPMHERVKEGGLGDSVGNRLCCVLKIFLCMRGLRKVDLGDTVGYRLWCFLKICLCMRGLRKVD